jgi:hypothetical protein
VKVAVAEDVEVGVRVWVAIVVALGDALAVGEEVALAVAVFVGTAIVPRARARRTPRRA